MATLNLSISNLETVSRAEAAPIILELGCRVVAARAAASRPSEDARGRAIRNALRTDCAGRMAGAMREEERQVQATAQLNGGSALDTVGASLSVTRNGGETDQDYRARLSAANDIEAKPVRAAIVAAMDAAVAALLDTPGPVQDLLNASTDELAD